MTSQIFTGGQIRTMTDADLPEAVLIERGRVIAIGTLTDVRRAATSTPEQIELDGRTLLPGFVDAHAHTVLHGSGIDWVDLSDAKTIDDIVSRLRARADERPGTSPVRGYGYDQSILAERRHPAAADLDRVSTDRHVQIQHASGHGYAVNSALLRDAGITRATTTPPGGRIDRDPAGTPVGVIFDSACDLLTGPDGVKVTNHGPNFHLPMSPDELARLFDLGQRSLLEAGITTVCDAQVTELEMSTYLTARDADRLTMRAHLLALSSNLEHLRELGMSGRLGDARLTLQGVKLYADGSVIARTARIGEHACCGRPAPKGYLYHEPEELIALIRTAHRLGLPASTHAQGEEPIEIVLDAVAAARAEDPKPHLHHRIEHCGFPTDSQITRMRELDVTPVPQPMQVHLYGDSLLHDYGDYGARFYPYGSFERAGLPIVLSSDAPVTRPGPLRAVWAAVTRQTALGNVAVPASEAVTRTAALRGITRTPADLLGRPDLGRIEPGVRADLVLVDSDPLTADIDAVARTAVTETWVAGKQVAALHGLGRLS